MGGGGYLLTVLENWKKMHAFMGMDLWKNLREIILMFFFIRVRKSDGRVRIGYARVGIRYLD